MSLTEPEALALKLSPYVALEVKLQIVRVSLGAIAWFAVASSASARPAEARLSLAAEVASFCKIDAPAPMVSASGDIGMVAEVCNAPGAYQVRASFTNLAAGVVTAGDQQAAIDATGAATFVRSGPRRQQQAWSLKAARSTDPSRPILVHLSVMPM